MDLVKIYSEIIRSPSSSKPYKDLVAYYSQSNYINESTAFTILIDRKFGKNDNNSDLSDGELPRD